MEVVVDDGTLAVVDDGAVVVVDGWEPAVVEVDEPDADVVVVVGAGGVAVA